MVAPRPAKPIVKMVGIWDVWDDAEREFGVHWRFMVKHFGVDTLYMTPVTGVAEKLKNILDFTETEFIELPALEEAISANPNLTPVLVDENGAMELAQFKHPQDALYIFGKVGTSPLDKFAGKYTSVRIPSWAKDPNVSRGLLHPHQAASIILYDRMTKLWQ